MANDAFSAIENMELNKKFYLWHLQKIGLIKDDLKVPAWNDELPDVRVAIIDSGCSTLHPNLPSHAIVGALDVAVVPDGAIYESSALPEMKQARAELIRKLKPILAKVDKENRAKIMSRAEKFIETAPEILNEENPAEWLSAHGTACAGLVAGRTLKESLEKPCSLVSYFGVNPYANVIPITTPYSHEIAPLITALFHAIAHDADVILLPRSVNDLQLPGVVGDKERDGRLSREAKHLRATRFDADPALYESKEVFEHLLAAIAADRPVIVASGNDGRETLAYPASLVQSTAADLIVVGAANSNGVRSSYSSGTRKTGVTVYAPSDDEERIRNDVTRLDRETLIGKQIGQAIEVDKETHQYSPSSVLGLEPPGRLWGATEVELNPKETPFQQLYSPFGGTSAASSIVAGVVSLMIAQAKKSKSGKLTSAEIKSMLSDHAHEKPMLKQVESREKFGKVSILDVTSLLGLNRPKQPTQPNRLKTLSL